MSFGIRGAGLEAEGWNEEEEVDPEVLDGDEDAEEDGHSPP